MSRMEKLQSENEKYVLGLENDRKAYETYKGINV